MSADRIPSSVLQLGDPRLRARTVPVLDVHDPEFLREVRALSRTLEDFRDSRGFGRAISAPQIGIPKRFFVIDVGEGPFLMANPEITWRSDGRFSMWDDCMSFPTLLVRVQRHESLSIRYVGENGETREWKELTRSESELVQHELDHLDGALAIDRAHGEGSIVTRAMFEEAPARYLAEVDYAIPTRPKSNRPPPPRGVA
jgi:peptide deformylase